MVTTFSTLVRCSCLTVLAVVSASLCLTPKLAAQVPTVVSSSPFAVPHNEVYGAPWQNAPSNRGDFVLFDFKTSGLYQYPTGNGKEITLAAQGKVAGGFTDSGIAVDPRNNNIYLDNNFNGGLLKFPYDAATGTWDLPSVTVAGGLAGNLGGSCGNYFQSAGLSINNNGVMVVATENGCGVELFTVPIDAAGNFGAATPIASGLTKRAKTVAIDDAGNIYFNEDAGGPAGALFFPAGTTGLVGDATAVRIDPMLGNVQGVSVDRAGNVYVGDGTAGVYLVPLVAGVPAPAKSVLLTTAPAQSNPSLDQSNGILFVPISSWNGFSDLVKMYLNRAELGSTTVGSTSAAATTIYYSFSAATTPASFVIEESGAAGDFALATTGTCAAATAYAANSSCTVAVNLTPHTVGDVSGTLAMLDAKGNVLNTTLLHGVGQGASVVIAPATESAIGSALKIPTQVAVDASGNVYVADTGLGKVLAFAKGSTAGSTPSSIGTGLIAPTGVAVDGSGNVFIADSGSVIEVPYGAAGLNAAGQRTLKSGFGANLQLAADGIGNVFVADPANARVANLKSLVVGVAEVDLGGLTQLSAVATDGSGNLYVANGANLIKRSPQGMQTTVLTTLSNTTGLAVDASGAVYVTSTAQTVRIPNEGGTLNPADQIVLAAGVTKPTSVAVDTLGNVYIADGKSLNVDYVNANGNLNLGTLTTTSGSATGNVTIVNDGNASLTVKSFTATPDFSVTSNSCVGAAVAVGLTCNATVTFSPGPGDQGNLTGQLLVQGNAANAPIGIHVSGVGAGLAAATATITVNKPTVTNAPVVVTVAPSSGTGTAPTGNVTVTVTGAGLTPVVLTQALVSGTVTINEVALPVGSLTFTVKYAGDRTYGTATASTTAVVGVGAVVIVQPSAASTPIYVLVDGAGAQEPYDGSQQPFYYNYPVVVKAANGAPLLGVPILNSKGAQTGTDYGNVTYQLAGGTPGCLGTSAIIAVQMDGTAPFPTHCFPINTSNNQIPNIITAYTVTPVYTGNTDPNYAPAMGVPVTFIAIRNPMVLLSTPTPALTVAAGSSVSANITLTSLLGYGVTGVNGNLNNYSLPVTMDCDALPAHATCSFAYPVPDPSDPASVAVNPTMPGKVVLTLNTNVSAGTYASIARTPAYLAGMFGLGMFGLAVRRRKGLRVSLLHLVVAMIFSGAMFGLSACSSANISAIPSLSTPKGTYTITVTAKQAGSKQVPNPTPGGAPITVNGNGNQMSIPFTMSVTVQ
jgi:hypothetical protein